MVRQVEKSVFGFNKTEIDPPAKVEAELYPADNESFIEPAMEVAAGSEEVSRLSYLLSKEQIAKSASSRIVKPSSISEGFELTGEIVSQGSLHVEGRINGNIKAENVTIGSKGAVKGSVKCHSLAIKGEFSGDAACNNLSLSGNAVVNGDIRYRSLTMAAGTILKGTVTRY